MSQYTISRRRLLASLAASTALAVVPSGVRAARARPDTVFRHGVASGDPNDSSVVLWTRITDTDMPQVLWEVSTDMAFSNVVTSGSVLTGADRDYTVKLLADGLQPGTVYYYRFSHAGAWSPVGRTRTLPSGRVDRLGIALASCSNYPFGFFNAYDAIAHDQDVEFVLHTGDYIYEYGADGWDSEMGQTLDRVHEPAHEIVSLTDYRQRHAQYKTDAGSQAMHAAHPLLACWDDHESTNNPWKDGAQNHQPDTEGDWAARRAASIQAYFEWMPVREPEWLETAGRDRMQFWRSYSFGDLAMLHTLETRHTARAEQINYSDYADTLKSQEDASHLVEDVLGAADRPMLSPQLEADLSLALKTSVDAEQPWRLIGNPMPIARTRVPDVTALGLVPDPEKVPDVSMAAKILAWKGKWDLPFYPDTWDGYGWARERLYELSRSAGAGDLIFLTGDSHSFWANRLADGRGRPAGIELGTAGISSPGDFVESGFGLELSPLLDEAFIKHNPEIVWTDNMHQGYVRVILTHTSGQADFVAVDTVLSRDYFAGTIRSFTLSRRADGIDIAYTPIRPASR